MSTSQTVEREHRILDWAKNQVGTAGWEQKLLNLIEQERAEAKLEALELIADGEGWEESREHYRRELGLTPPSTKGSE